MGVKLLLSCLGATMMLLAPLIHSATIKTISLNNSAAAMKTISLNKSLKAFNDWTCSKPQPRVIHIENLDEYFAPNLIYIPSALILHQCDQSTGCCKSTGQVCKSVESAEEKVQFAVRTIGNNYNSGISSGDSPTSSSAISAGKPKNNNKRKKEKKLMVTLTNHTRCECVGKVDLRV